MEVFIESSKSDQYRDGAIVVIARTDTECCPVAMVQRYMRLAGISLVQPSDKFLFRRLVNTKNGQKQRFCEFELYTCSRVSPTDA